jgi:hypothetical protein
VNPSPDGTAPQTLVAVSVADGPFVWVNQTALLAGLPKGSQIQIETLYANTVAVYAEFYVISSSGVSTTLTKVSTDQGATWSVFQPQYQGKKVQVVDLPDGHTLIGEVVSDQSYNTGLYVTSTDGGATWTSIAPAPGDLLIVELVSTPSGTYYAEMIGPNGSATAVPGVYRLAPGRSTWVLVGALPPTPIGAVPLTFGVLLAVSWDEQGHPLALWSSGMSGLATHTP